MAVTFELSSARVVGQTLKVGLLARFVQSLWQRCAVGLLVNGIGIWVRPQHGPLAVPTRALTLESKKPLGSTLHAAIVSAFKPESRS